MHFSVFRYNNFVYVTAGQEMLVQTEEYLRNLDLLLIECNNGISLVDNGNSDIFKVKKVLSDLKPKQAVLTHLSTRVDYEVL